MCVTCPVHVSSVAAMYQFCLQGQSCPHVPSTGYGPDVCTIRTSYVSCQCTSSDGDSALPLACFLPLEETAAPYLLRRLLLLTSRGDCFSLPLEETAAPYLPRRHYSLVIASGPEVAFVTPAILVDRFNMGWFCLRNIMS
ncbi:hypothetical protein Tco_0477971 [Tanacetum coccineum]